MSDGTHARLLLEDTSQLITALRERLTQSLEDLATCRGLLDSQDSSHEFEFSAKLEDHADVLQVPLPIHNFSRQTVASQTTPNVCPAMAEVASQATLEVAEAAIQTDCEEVPSALTAMVSSEATEPPLVASPASASVMQSSDSVTPPVAAAPQTATDAAGVAVQEHIEKFEEELSMAKALLMLNNVTLNMDFDQEGQASSASEIVTLRGNPRLIQLLVTLKQKVTLLNRQYLLLRGDMLYLNHEMNVCRHWVLQSFRAAMQHQSSEHSSLQSRFERLSKVLN
jgi:hypothetical protein